MVGGVSGLVNGASLEGGKVAGDIESVMVLERCFGVRFDLIQAVDFQSNSRVDKTTRTR